MSSDTSSGTAAADRSVGHPLDVTTRTTFERLFERPLDHVRVHTGPRAAAATSAIRSDAFALGHDIVFGHERYKPRSPGGLRLLTHELIHVLQHDVSAAQPLRISDQPSSVEHEAKNVQSELVSMALGERPWASVSLRRAAAHGIVHRQPTGYADWTADKEKVFLEWWKKIAGLEGSYEQWKANPQNNKYDRGGKTNFGITWNTFHNVRPNASEADFDSMSLDQALGIARGLYRRYKADQIKNPGVALLISDWQWGGINAAAINRALARTGQPPIAKFTNEGPTDATVDALNAALPNEMIAALDEEKLRSIDEDVAAHPKQAVFETGWTIRAIKRWVQAKMLTERDADAARWLNGQSKARIEEVLAGLTKEEIAKLHIAATTADGVGPQSQFARITKSRYEAYQARP